MYIRIHIQTLHLRPNAYAMSFHREVYVTVKLISSFSQDQGMTHPLSEDCQRFFALKTLELYHRSLSVVGGESALEQEKDKLVGVCFLMMHKFYDTSPMLSLEAYYPFFNDLCPIGNAVEYRKTYTKMEAAVLKCVNWTLSPYGAPKSIQAAGFFEPWQFDQDALCRPAGVFPVAAEVEAACDAQYRSMRLLMAAKRTASWFSCSGFFMRCDANIPERLRPLLAGVARLCHLDCVFCNTVWTYCAERYRGQVPAYIDVAALSDPALPGMDCPDADASRAEMVAGLARHVAGEIRKSIGQMQTVAELVSAPASPGAFLEARKVVKGLVDQQLVYQGITSTLQSIHHASLHECRELLNTLVSLIERYAPVIKCGMSRQGAPVTVFTTTKRERGHLICTRVSSDPYKTPATGRKHSVDVILGPVKVLIKTTAVTPGSRHKKVIKVEVKKSYLTACNHMAAAYVARSLAADAAISAANASEEAERASAAEHSAAAAAASAAAEEAEEAAFAADEAEKLAKAAEAEAMEDAA